MEKMGAAEMLLVGVKEVAVLEKEEVVVVVLNVEMEVVKEVR